jgi:hypothetical protein
VCVSVRVRVLAGLFCRGVTRIPAAPNPPGPDQRLARWQWPQSGRVAAGGQAPAQDMRHTALLGRDEGKGKLHDQFNRLRRVHLVAAPAPAHV